MSKIYDALKQAEQDRVAGQRDALLELSSRLTDEITALRATIDDCRGQLQADSLARVGELQGHIATLATAVQVQEQAGGERDKQLQQLLRLVSSVDEHMRAALAKLTSEREEIVAQLGSQAPSVADIEALQVRLVGLESATQSANVRVDRTAESFATAVGSLHLRVDEQGQRFEGTAQKMSEEIAAVMRSVETHVENVDRDSLVATAARHLQRITRLEESVASLQGSLEGANSDRLRRDDEATQHTGQLQDELRHLSEEAARSAEKNRLGVEQYQSEITRLAEATARAIAASTSLSQQIDALSAEKAALREAIGAQARQVAEAMQLHRTSLSNALEGQIEPLRLALRETAARLDGRIDTLKMQSGFPSHSESTTASINKFQAPLSQVVGDGTGRPQTAPRNGQRWRRGSLLATSAAAVLLCGVVVPRLLSAPVSTKGSNTAAGASFASLQDPILADRFATGLKALQRGDFVAAEKAFREVVLARPSCVEARNNLAVALDQQQRREAAAEQLREAIRIRPDYERARRNLERLRSDAGALSQELGADGSVQDG